MKTKEIDLRMLWTEFEGGAPLTKIAKRHKMSRMAVSRELQQDSKLRYRRIMKTCRTAKKNVDLRAIWSKLVRGTALRRIAQKEKMSDATLSKKLRQDDEAKYECIMKTRRTAKKAVDLQAVWAELESGMTTLGRIAQKYEISRPGLAKKLRRDNKLRYKKIMKLVRVNRDIFRGYFGSPEARKYGADSLFELEVKRLLEKHKVKYRFHVTLRLGKYRYIPDFVLSDNIVLEATGFFTDDYWRYYREKAKNYIKAGYLVFVVVPDHRRKKAEEYLPNEVRIIKYGDFKNSPTKTLRVLRIKEYW